MTIKNKIKSKFIKEAKRKRILSLNLVKEAVIHQQKKKFIKKVQVK